jgi:hypothetical protein
MKHVPIKLFDSRGAALGSLAVEGHALAQRAEEVAHRESLTKPTAARKVLCEALATQGYGADDEALRDACLALDKVRRGDPPFAIQITVSPSKAPTHHSAPAPIATKSPSPMQLPPYFETHRRYPDPEARAWHERLVGLDDHKRRLLTELRILLLPDQIEAWSKKHHGRVLGALALLRQRVPLALLAGDVGSGKTALAETIGSPLAEHTGRAVQLFKVNTQVRGTGLVGEMSERIAQAFAFVVEVATRNRNDLVLMLVDEADALAATRASDAMHHEDRAGINTLLQRLDGLRLNPLPIAVLFITNRPDALDPAIRRRVALELRFTRPNDTVRRQLFEHALKELELSEAVIDELVVLTGPENPNNRGLGFTASDVTDRLLPEALRAAYLADRPLDAAALRAAAANVAPSPGGFA